MLSSQQLQQFLDKKDLRNSFEFSLELCGVGSRNLLPQNPEAEVVGKTRLFGGQFFASLSQNHLLWASEIEAIFNVEQTTASQVKRGRTSTGWPSKNGAVYLSSEKISKLIENHLTQCTQLLRALEQDRFCKLTLFETYSKCRI